MCECVLEDENHKQVIFNKWQHKSLWISNILVDSAFVWLKFSLFFIRVSCVLLHVIIHNIIHNKKIHNEIAHFNIAPSRYHDCMSNKEMVNSNGHHNLNITNQISSYKILFQLNIIILYWDNRERRVLYVHTNSTGWVVNVMSLNMKRSLFSLLQPVYWYKC